MLLVLYGILRKESLGKETEIEVYLQSDNSCGSMHKKLGGVQTEKNKKLGQEGQFYSKCMPIRYHAVAKPVF